MTEIARIENVDGETDTPSTITESSKRRISKSPNNQSPVLGKKSVTPARGVSNLAPATPTHGLPIPVAKLDNSQITFSQTLSGLSPHFRGRPCYVLSSVIVVIMIVLSIFAVIAALLVFFTKPATQATTTKEVIELLTLVEASKAAQPATEIHFNPAEQETFPNSLQSPTTVQGRFSPTDDSMTDSYSNDASTFTEITFSTDESTKEHSSVDFP